MDGAQFPAGVRRQDTAEDVDGICSFSGTLSPPLPSHYVLILGRNARVLWGATRAWRRGAAKTANGLKERRVRRRGVVVVVVFNSLPLSRFLLFRPVRLILRSNAVTNQLACATPDFVFCPLFSSSTTPVDSGTSRESIYSAVVN